MVEGGGEVAQSFLDAGLVDEIVIARSPRTMAQITGHDMPATSLALIATLALEGRCGAYERVEQFGVGRDTITTWRSGTLVQALARAAR